MKEKNKHVNLLEINKGFLMQISIIASLLIVLIVFETKSSSVEETVNHFTEIELDIYRIDSNIKPPLPENRYNKQTIPAITIENKLNQNSKQAEFKGGEDELIKYLMTNKNYTEEIKKQNIKGRVYVRFSISEKGKIANVEIIRKIHPIIDKEALRLINAMPDWNPAELNGKPIESSQILPVIFK
jgi:protein TonB